MTCFFQIIVCKVLSQKKSTFPKQFLPTHVAKTLGKMSCKLVYVFIREIHNSFTAEMSDPDQFVFLNTWIYFGAGFKAHLNSNEDQTRKVLFTWGFNCPRRGPWLTLVNLGGHEQKTGENCDSIWFKTLHFICFFFTFSISLDIFSKYLVVLVVHFRGCHIEPASTDLHRKFSRFLHQIPLLTQPCIWGVE